MHPHLPRRAGRAGAVPVLIAAAAAVALSAASCSRGGSASVTPQQRQAITQAIETEMRAANDPTKPNLAARILSLYADTGRIVSASGGRAITARDTIAAGIHYFVDNVAANMRDPHWIWDRMYIDVLAPDAAVLTATYHIPHINPHGQPHVIGGAWTAVFQKRGDRWVIIQEHLSDLPQQSAMDSAMKM